MHFIISTRDQQHTVIVENIAPLLSAQVAIETCGWCGQEFLLAATHQKFCSNRCRMNAFRKGSRQPIEAIDVR